jgi:hypothetical protein
LFNITINIDSADDDFQSIARRVRHVNQPPRQTDTPQRRDHAGGRRQARRQARRSLHNHQNASLQRGTKIWLASVIPQAKYRIVISDATWIHTAPVDPGAYSAAALAAGGAAAQREQLVAKHKQLQSNYASYLGVKEAGKELILYAVGADALAPLKKQYIGFGDSTILTRKNSSNTCFLRKCDSMASSVVSVIWQQHLEENLVLNPIFCESCVQEQHFEFFLFQDSIFYPCLF